MRRTFAVSALGLMLCSLGCNWMGRWRCDCNCEPPMAGGYTNGFIAPEPTPVPHPMPIGNPLSLEQARAPRKGQIRTVAARVPLRTAAQFPAQIPMEEPATEVRHAVIPSEAPVGARSNVTILGRTPSGELILVVAEPGDQGKVRRSAAMPAEAPVQEVPEFPMIRVLPLNPVQAPNPE